MQTWFIQNGSIRPCMILREHVNDDTFGRNLEPEPVGYYNYDKTQIANANTLTDVNNNSVTGVFENYNIIASTGADPAQAENTQTGIAGSIIDGLFNWTMMLSAPINDPTQVQAFLDDMYNLLGSWDKSQQLVEVFDLTIFPTAFSNHVKLRDTYTKSFAMPTTFDLYSPKNKKLLTYPYNFLAVTSKDGSCGQYKWELFNDVLNNNPTFKLNGTMLGGGNIICYPQSYNGIAEDVDSKVVMDNFPKSAFSYDAYQAWIAAGGKTRLQTAERFNNARMFIDSAKIAITAGKAKAQNSIQAARAGLDYISGNYISMGLRAADITAKRVQTAGEIAPQIIDIMEAKNKISYQWKDAEYQPNIVIGTPSPTTAVGFDYLNFYFIQVHIRENEAKHIDDFFSMYGYAINKVKTPNLTGRQHWNFVQTENCVVAGDMPSSSKEAIARIFDGGITFWHNGDNVGNYNIASSNGSIDNPIV